MADFDPKSLGRGTYYVPDVGLVFNGKVLDGDDPTAVQKYHDGESKSREQAVAALAERDAVIVEVVSPDEPSDSADVKE